MANVAGVQAAGSATYVRLDGGAKFYDKTSGVAQVVFSKSLSDKHKQSTYEVSINKKKLILPITAVANVGLVSLVLFGSTTIKVKNKGDGLFKITKVDSKGKNKFYVDTRNVVDDIAHYVYNYVPKVVSLEEAKAKFAHLQSEFPKFKGDRIAFNRHGVGVFGFTPGKGYDFFWAKPSDEKVGWVDCFYKCRNGDGGSSYAVSREGFVHFHYKAHDDTYFINAEPAVEIVMTD